MTVMSQNQYRAIVPSTDQPEGGGKSLVESALILQRERELCKTKMPLCTQEADDVSDYVLVAKLDNARSMSNILKAIHFKDVRRL